MFNLGTPTDPFAAKILDLAHRPFSDASDRDQRSPRLVAGDRTLVLIAAGQSNIANYMDTASFYTVTNTAKVDNLNFLDGGVYDFGTKVLGADGIYGIWLGKLADLMIDDDFYDRVIIVPLGVGNSYVSDWAAGNLRDHILVAQRRCAALGLTPDAIMWQQGENDDAITQADYTSRLQVVIDRARSEFPPVPWLLAKSTLHAGATIATVRAAIDAMVDGETIFAGPDTDALTGLTNRKADLTHFNLTGGMAAAALWQTSLLAVL
jgi:hypothetical protein